MVRPRKPEGHDLARLVEGLLLFGEPITRFEVVSKIFRNKIGAKKLDRLLKEGQAQGLIEVKEGHKVYEVRKPATLIVATDKAREKP
jgi:hypothetical protein